MKKEGKRGRRKNFLPWVCGMVLGAHLLGCASPAPKSEAPLPPVRRTPTAQQVSATVPDPRLATQEPAPPASANVPALPAKVATARAEPPSEPPETSSAKAALKEPFHVHVVRWNGETFSAVAAWYTGDAKNWKMLAEASPEINPKRIREGNKILIPERLLKTREAMPREFLDRFYSKAKKEKPRPKPQPSPAAQEGEMQLFGPRKSPTR